MRYKNTPITTKDEYLNPYLENNVCKDEFHSKSKIEAALEQALDIRKFEIDLYWKRANHFWLFLAALFTAYFTVISKDQLELKAVLSLLLSGLGVFVSVCWFYVNKASKYWQEHWERHVDLLEDTVMGPLYKTTLVYSKEDQSWWRPFKPYNYSVSKINQFFSFVMIWVWAFLFLYHSVIVPLQIGEKIKKINRSNVLQYLILSASIIIPVVILAALLRLLTRYCKSSETNKGGFSMSRKEFE